MTDTNAVKPWAAKGLASEQRAAYLGSEIGFVIADEKLVVEAIEAACADALADAAPKWISVKERLPKIYDHVLICLPSGTFVIGFWTDTRWLTQSGLAIHADIVGWMPLPHRHRRKTPSEDAGRTRKRHYKIRHQLPQFCAMQRMRSDCKD